MAFIQPEGEPAWYDGEVINTLIADPSRLMEQAGVGSD